MTTRVVFPIKSSTACLLKWSWSSIFFQSGTSASCHRTQNYPIDPDNFSSFHNLPEKIQARNKMLSGEWPGAGCEYCKNIEEAGGESDRKFQLAQLNNTNLIPAELHVDNGAVSVTPTILEVWFRNTCNMACIYCGPHFSSRWEDENRKYGNFFKKESQIDKYSTFLKQNNPDYEKMVADFWKYLESNNNAAKVTRFHILGGEPFLMDELDKTISTWAKHGHPDLEIAIISNLNIPHKIFKKYIKKFELLAKHKKMWRLQLTASLEGWGEQQEYTRYGLSLSLWEQNFKYILNTPWILPSINSTMSSLTIKVFPDLLEKINQWNQHQEDVSDGWRTTSNKILHSFNTTGDENIDNVYIFGGEIFQQDFDRILNLMPDETDVQRGQKQMMAGIVNRSKKCSSNLKKIQQLKNYLTELDARRKTNWKQTFPWLEQIKT
jgi:organic radical activating enzyme